MALKRNVLVLPLLGIAFISAIWFVLNRGQEPQIIQSGDHLKEETSRDSDSDARSSVRSAEEEVAILENGTHVGTGRLAFSVAGHDVREALDTWLHLDYIPNMAMAEHHLRSDLIEVNLSELETFLRESNESIIDSPSLQDNVKFSEQDIVIRLFENITVRASVIHYRVGRNSGLITARLRSVGRNSSTDNIYLEISKRSGLKGVVDTVEGYFQIRSTSMPNVLVVSEMNTSGIYQSLKLE